MLRQIFFVLVGVVVTGFGVFYALNSRIVALEAKGTPDFVVVGEIPGLIRAELERYSGELVPVSSTGVAARNDAARPLFITGYCNATISDKEIEARVGKPGESPVLVTTANGSNRINVAFIVPPGQEYTLTYSTVEGLGCTFRGWRL